MKSMKEILPGVILAAALAVAATLLGKALPIVGGPVFAIVLGILISSLWGRPKAAGKGLGFASKKILQWSIVALGANLSLAQVGRGGTVFSVRHDFYAVYGVCRRLCVREADACSDKAHQPDRHGHGHLRRLGHRRPVTNY
jgi:hypothetical protein